MCVRVFFGGGHGPKEVMGGVNRKKKRKEASSVSDMPSGIAIALKGKHTQAETLANFTHVYFLFCFSSLLLLARQLKKWQQFGQLSWVAIHQWNGEIILTHTHKRTHRDIHGYTDILAHTWGINWEGRAGSDTEVRGFFFAYTTNSFLNVSFYCSAGLTLLHFFWMNCNCQVVIAVSSCVH